MKQSSLLVYGFVVGATGEAAGLLWSYLQFDMDELVVRHTSSRVGTQLVLPDPKMNRSRSRVPLHAGVLPQLKAHRTRQLQERLQAGDQLADTGVVIATEFGPMVDPRNLLRGVEKAARKAGIEDVGAHATRHSAAVGWLELGVHIEAVADLLGHSSVAVTDDRVRPCV
jgi:integrase